MNQFSRVWKPIGYSFGAGAAASLAVLLIGMCVFGVQFSEWEGRFVGAVGTIAGIAGAVVGLRLSRKKSTLNTFLLGGALLLASATESRALPPRQHAVSGVISKIDYDAHTITLAPAKSEKPLVFVWKNSTRFSQGWSRVCLGALEPGQPVKVHYRREVGQLVPREVSLRKETPTRCTTGGCCAKRS